VVLGFDNKLKCFVILISVRTNITTMLKNLLAAFTFFIVFANTISAQDNYFLAYYNKAEKLYEAEDYINAKIYYDSAININPKHAFSYFKRGKILYGDANLEDAIKDFTTSISIDNTNAEAYNFRGDAKIWLKDTLGGIRDLDTCIQIKPFSYYYRLDRGTAYLRLDSNQLALKDFKYAYQLNATRQDAPFHIGVAFFHLEEYDSSFAYLNKATEIDSLMPGSYYFRAKINYIEDYYNAALEEINTAIKLVDDKDYYYVLRAKIYIYNDNENDDELAIEDLNKAIKLGSKEAREILLEYF
jgi:tetratricopeptide (TPR) repeat protein